MKRLQILRNLFVPFVAVAAISNFASADVHLKLGKSAQLPHCDGEVEATDSPQGRSGEQVNLVFSGLVNCDTFDILSANGDSVGYSSNKLDKQKGGYYGGSRTIPKRYIDQGSNKVVVKVSKGGKYDKIIVQFREDDGEKKPPKKNPQNDPPKNYPPQKSGEPGTTSYMNAGIGSYRTLESCGGTIQITRSDNSENGQLNMHLKGVQYCSNFDILAASGDTVRYPSKEIPGSYGNWGGSFTMPKKYIDPGYNYIRVAIQSDTKKTRDIITIRFDGDDVTPNPGNGENPGSGW